MLESLDQQPIAVGHLGNQLMNRGLALDLVLAQQGQTLARSHQHLERAGLAMAPAVLAGLVDVEALVGMLDHRHTLAKGLEFGDQLLDQRGLADAGRSKETQDLHATTIIKRNAARHRP